MKLTRVLAVLVAVVLSVVLASLTSRPVAGANPSQVTVVNTPLPVSDVNNPLRQPVQLYSECQAQPNCGFNPFYTVPSGKLLVIETVTASMQVPSGQKALVTLFVQDPAVLHPASFFITLEPQGTFTIGNAVDIFTGTHRVQIYAGAGQTVSVGGQQNASTGFVDLRFSLSGYLVDCPISSSSSSCLQQTVF